MAIVACVEEPRIHISPEAECEGACLLLECLWLATQHNRCTATSPSPETTDSHLRQKQIHLIQQAHHPQEGGVRREGVCKSCQRQTTISLRKQRMTVNLIQAHPQVLLGRGLLEYCWTLGKCSPGGSSCLPNHQRGSPSRKQSTRKSCRQANLTIF